MHDHDHQNEGTTHLDFDSPAMAAFAELEGEALLGLFAEAISLVAELGDRHGVEVRRVLDIGCGPGVGTCCLAEQFTAASVVAVDGSATMLEHVAARAARLGLASRVDTHLAELPTGLSTLGRADIAWASMVLHHVGDEVDALSRITELLEPAGLLAVVERGDPLRVQTDDADLGRPGLWERLDTASGAWFGDMRAELPGSTTSTEYAAMLDNAGFELVAERVLRLVLDAPLDTLARRFAHEHLQRMRTRLARHADPADLEALDLLIDEHTAESIMRRNDARLCTSRRLYVATRAT
jgi:SAM-dependent methyltransferase